MIRIRVATNNNRGFLKALFEYPFENIVFDYNVDSIYEKPKKWRLFLYKLVRLKIFDFFGVFRTIKVKKPGADICLSYNRFLDTEMPYIIILEDPAALVHYCRKRPRYLLTKLRLRQKFNAPELKAIICLSDICCKGVRELYEIPDNMILKRIYPLITEDKSYTVHEIEKKVQKPVMECLFISVNFYQKGGKDIIKAFSLLKDKHINLTIVTVISRLRQEELDAINAVENITLKEFNLSKSQIYELYKNTAILLHPTRVDSFGLVVLEAMKYGCALITTDTFAIREMNENGFNGYSVFPKYSVWNEDGTYNEQLTSYQKKKVLPYYVDGKMVKLLEEKLRALYEDRALLYQMCLHSFEKATTTEFSEQHIAREWDALVTNCCGLEKSR